MAIIVFINQATYSVDQKDGRLVASELDSLPVDVQAAACAGPGVYYVVPAGSPKTLCRWTRGATELLELITFSSAIIKIVWYRNKIFCAIAGDDTLHSYDPLCKVVERLEVECQVANFEPAEHGFVVQDPTGVLHGYHFNSGTSIVQGTGKGTCILGRYKNIVIVFAPELAGIAGVTETSAVVETDLQVPIVGPFVLSDDKIVCYDPQHAILVLPDGKSLPLPARHSGTVLLGAVPAVDEEPLCTICYCEFDGNDGLTFDCGHFFHYDCVMEWASQWDAFKAQGKHIVFTNSVCPGGCKSLMRHPSLEPSKQIRVLDIAMRHATAEALVSLQKENPAVTDEDILFYLCSHCGRPFLGGDRVCYRMLAGEPLNKPEDLVCDLCRTDTVCEKHGREFAFFKCSYCCNPATQRSFATRYMCERCNALWRKSEPDPIPCPGTQLCPLGGAHPKEGQSVIGCLLCVKDGEVMLDRVVQPPPTETSVPTSHE